MHWTEEEEMQGISDTAIKKRIMLYGMKWMEEDNN